MPLIHLPHKVLDYCCPVNGLEDQYEAKTGARLPGFLMMDLSNIGFIYIKQQRAPAPRMLGWGDGAGKGQYAFLADLMGFRWQSLEGRPFDEAWRAACASVERGLPPVLGMLDMYHLPHYPKFYHRVHIPWHYLLLVGYDDARQVALVQDNGLPGVQELPLSDLRQAWNVSSPGLGKRNSLFTFEFAEHPASLPELLQKGLKKRARQFLNPPKSFLGLPGMRKSAAEMLRWKDELSEAQWMESLRFLATFSCSVVPNPPQRLLGFPLGYEDPHQAFRDRFTRELAPFAAEYRQPQWQEAIGLLQESGRQIGQIIELTVDALLGKSAALQAVPGLLLSVAEIEERAFRLLL